jgi:hypothetical protein
MSLKPLGSAIWPGRIRGVGSTVTSVVPRRVDSRTVSTVGHPVYGLADLVADGVADTSPADAYATGGGLVHLN